ncbi:hypothetical protein ACHIPZ_03890 [Antrihabitans sp. NCIMB 15449]|uniref:Uncharacterized protein n=1 Tax=Antrihabitans spumae TaxID=3373370 RepID=A0ABW7JHA0_9NOCA
MSNSDPTPQTASQTVEMQTALDESSSATAFLGWGITANVSRELFVRQNAGTKRPGTRYFVPGARIWVLPVRWGDGGEKRHVVGTRRRTHGTQLIHLVLNTRYLVNYRARPIYSQALLTAMLRGWLGQPEDVVYESEAAAHEEAVWRKERTTRDYHLGLVRTPEAHAGDELCRFCAGYRDSVGLTTAPAELATQDINPGESQWTDWRAPGKRDRLVLESCCP